MGLAVGVAVGLAAGLLAAPMRGSDMRANLRERAADGSGRLQSLASSYQRWALQALDRGVMLIEEGRRAFDTTPTTRIAEQPVMLTATLGEIAQMHDAMPTLEARS